MKIIQVKDYQAMSEKACELIVERMQKLENPVLGLATGSTPEGLYKCLIKKNKEGKVSFKNTTTFNLDEYVGISKEDPNSYVYFMNDKLFDHVDIAKENVHLPSGLEKDMDQECENYEQMIRNAGGIDVQVLGIGVNGHIGFNEPGTPFTKPTHVVELTDSTREANARFFASKDEVPTHAISMGPKTIMQSKEILLLISGENKADAVAQLIEGDVDEQMPASILQKHDHVTVIADEAALSKTKNK
ncbi:glucosamine-6-phosphate deaminase [Bacilli bacterium]|uniref:glucosamine-6-phosphate deaminase n=1 Tax=Oceanobacillus caeni TaxID=405946 RepID=UPI0006222614|nr:glucosamine-6-phosphate deaminase [Bacilli bacterium VT-13-104]PZD87986.1 glucosamine-6-phosphate deaminase [Bacilli bacterium]PZD90177.1 glucosamine-6-phosphate deaminase [Bacilli bacterium]PZD92071.1 glucosamine-6-phosphate deaminase [Bacilli bacterium]RCO06955.1 glucosamine-6-phosphate deaminase [Bacilli bacterium]